MRAPVLHCESNLRNIKDMFKKTDMVNNILKYMEHYPTKCD